ncbi:hypothetical protein [Bremerella cremea]|uniref:hypothetical protein n=1 Tax=Bremerella cremea TaxID=1031537 RepID=UPI0031E832B2
MCSHPQNHSSQCHHYQKPKANVLGAWGFGISLFGLIATFGLLCPLGLLLSFLGLFSRRRGMAIAGLIIGGVGTMIVAVGVGSIAMAASAAHYYSVEAPKIAKTQQVLDHACVVVESYRQENGQLPEGIEGNKLVIEIEDAFGNAVRYEPEDGNQFAIRSAGPDGDFDTSDDIRMLSSQRGLAEPIETHETSHRHVSWSCQRTCHW